MKIFQFVPAMRFVSVIMLLAAGCGEYQDTPPLPASSEPLLPASPASSEPHFDSVQDTGASLPNPRSPRYNTLLSQCTPGEFLQASQHCDDNHAWSGMHCHMTSCQSNGRMIYYSWEGYTF